MLTASTLRRVSSTEHDVAARTGDAPSSDERRSSGNAASERSRSKRGSGPVLTNGDHLSESNNTSRDLPTEPLPVVPTSSAARDEPTGTVPEGTDARQVQGDPLITGTPATTPEPSTNGDSATARTEPAVDPGPMVRSEPGPAARSLDDQSTPTRRPILGRRATIVDAERHLIAPVQRVIGRRPRVRKVTRVVRHVDPWTVFKVAAVFSVVLYGVMLTAGVLLWNVAHTTGTVENVERFMESFGWETFEFNGGQIYRAAWVAGLFGIIGLTGLAVLLATLFNLITDLVGGVRFTVLEEEVVEKTTSPMKRFVVRHTDDSTGTPRPVDPLPGELDDEPSS